MKDIDQEALEIVEKWEREAAGNPYSQQKAMLQVAVIKILKDREIFRARLEALVGEYEQQGLQSAIGSEKLAVNGAYMLIAQKIREIIDGQ